MVARGNRKDWLRVCPVARAAALGAAALNVEGIGFDVIDANGGNRTRQA